MPLVRARFDFERQALEAALEGGQRPADALGRFVFRELAEHLAIALAEERGEALRLLERDELLQLGLSFDEALDAAIKNLAAREPGFAPPRFTHLPGKGHVPQTSSSLHNASWLLFPEAIQRLPVNGQHVAFVPHSHSLYVSGSEHYEELRRLAAAVATEWNSAIDKSVALIPMVLDGDRWRPWLPPVSHPSHAAIKELWCRHESRVYFEQTRLLRRLYAGKDAPCVAAYKVTELAAGSGPHQQVSLATWTQQTTLLPKTDAVMLLQVANQTALDRREADEPVIHGFLQLAWEELARHLGPRLKPERLYPQRFLAQRADFPSGDDWQKLAARQIALPLGFEEPVVVPPQPAPEAASAPATAPTETLPPPPPLPSIATPSSPSLWPVIVVGLLLISCLAGACGVGLYGVQRIAKALPKRRTPTQVAAVPFVPPPAVAPRTGAASPAAPRTLRQRSPNPDWPVISREEQSGAVGYEPDVSSFGELKSCEVELPLLACKTDEVVWGGDRESHRGSPFADVAPEGGWLVGLRVGRGTSWGGSIRSIQPIYQVSKDYRLGQKCSGGGEIGYHEFLAPPDHAIGAIHVRAGLVVNAVRVEYHKVSGQRLDPSDATITAWYGCDGGSIQPKRGGIGDPLVGIVGSSSPDIDRLNVAVAMPLPKPEKPLPTFQGESVRGPSAGHGHGTPFTLIAPDGGLLVGLRLFAGETFGGAIMAVQPIYQVADRYELGPRCGRAGGQPCQLLAKPGHAVSGLEVYGGGLVHSVRLIYCPVTAKGLSNDKPYASFRIGGQGGLPTDLDSDGTPVTGLSGTFSHNLNSLELVLMEQ